MWVGACDGHARLAATGCTLAWGSNISSMYGSYRYDCFDFSYDDMAFALMEIFDFTISRQAVADDLKNADWNVRATSRAEPLLRDDLGHFEARADFGSAHQRQDWECSDV